MNMKYEKYIKRADRRYTRYKYYNIKFRVIMVGFSNGLNGRWWARLDDEWPALTLEASGSLASSIAIVRQGETHCHQCLRKHFYASAIRETLVFLNAKDRTSWHGITWFYNEIRFRNRCFLAKFSCTQYKSRYATISWIISLSKLNRWYHHHRCCARLKDNGYLRKIDNIKFKVNKIKTNKVEFRCKFMQVLRFDLKLHLAAVFVTIEFVISRFRIDTTHIYNVSMFTIIIYER